MLDVHPPHNPVHGIRDFLLHLLTITVGLLIALGLEGAVEWRHHVHLRNEADANLLSELRDNSNDLQSTLRSNRAERDYLLGLQPSLKSQITGKGFAPHEITLGMNLSTLQDAAWQSAAATGAFSYMEYAHVKRYASAYKLQTEYLSLQHETLNGFLDLQAVLASGDPHLLSTIDAAKALEKTQQTAMRLEALQQIGKTLSRTYTEALQPEK